MINAMIWVKSVVSYLWFDGAVKSGFRSAPEEFKEAWGSFTRDLKGLLDR